MKVEFEDRIGMVRPITIEYSCNNVVMPTANSWSECEDDDGCYDWSDPITRCLLFNSIIDSFSFI